jgi:hypothetical protein
VKGSVFMRARSIPRSALGALVAFVVSFGFQSFAAEPAAKIDFGEPGPQWLRDSETYALWYGPELLDVLAQSKVKFITHCPVNREFFDRCHALGIRCLPYVTFYHGDAAGEEAGINIPCGPKAIEVDAEGNYRRSAFWQNEDNKKKYWATTSACSRSISTSRASTSLKCWTWWRPT